jgi:serine/threonine protein kinase
MRKLPATTTDYVLVFARKLLKPFSALSENEILNEFRAIKKLCIPPSHENLVAVYRYGKLTESLYYYIDMEVCDLNLEEYIYEFDFKNPSTSHEGQTLLALHTKSLMQIMRDISRGLTFIHENREVHRDIKPRNSICPFDLV